MVSPDPGVRYFYTLREKVGRYAQGAWDPEYRKKITPAILEDLAKSSVSSLRTADEFLGYYYMLHQLIDGPNTKRLMFDTRQAQVFDDTGEGPPKRMAGKVHMPFSQFYVELTEPLLVSFQEPGEADLLRAFAVDTVMHSDVENMAKEADDKRFADSVRGLIRVAAFLTEEQNSIRMVDRSFWLNPQTGIAYSTAYAILGSGSTLPDSISEHTLVPMLADYEEMPDREKSWYEHILQATADLFIWMMIYLMAKSIEIIPEPLTRQQRRLFERKKKIPEPWHVVKLEPIITQRGRGEPSEIGSEHSYRYDVIGHLRFGRHKLKDGSYRETVEWVPSHQRGLKNTLYIPKTYKVEYGKVIASESKRYFLE